MMLEINSIAKGVRGPTDADTTSLTANRGGFNRNVIDFEPDNIGSTNSDLNQSECIDENSIFQIFESNKRFAEMIRDCEGLFWNG